MAEPRLWARRVGPSLPIQGHSPPRASADGSPGSDYRPAPGSPVIDATGATPGLFASKLAQGLLQHGEHLLRGFLFFSYGDERILGCSQPHTCLLSRFQAALQQVFQFTEPFEELYGRGGSHEIAQGAAVSV